MGRKKKSEIAIDLASSTRGQWIIGRALRIAYLEMDKKPIERKEVSDMADMKLIGEELFPIGWQLQDIVQKQEEYFKPNPYKDKVTVLTANEDLLKTKPNEKEDKSDNDDFSDPY